MALEAVRGGSLFLLVQGGRLRRRLTPALGVIQISRVVKRALHRLQAPPRWLRWLEAAPLAVREADRSVRRAYLFYQLPCAALIVFLYAGAKHFGWLASRPTVALCLLLAGMVALGWPINILRLALAARRSVSAATGALALRLRILAAIGFLLAGLLGIGLASLGLVIVVTVALHTQSSP